MKLFPAFVFGVCGYCNAQVLFQNTYGGTNIDNSNSCQQTNDGGYIVVGSTASFGAGTEDVYLVKTDSDGVVLWTKTYGEMGSDYGTYVEQTNDGGYIITGYTSSFGAGNYDVYLIKTDNTGAVMWSKTFGGTNDDSGASVKQISDGYIVVGITFSFGNITGNIYLIKTDVSGNLLWSKSIGGFAGEEGNSIQLINGGGYIIAGSTSSFGAGNSDVYLIKTDSSGNVFWSKAYGGSNSKYAYSVKEISGHYIITGYTESFGAGNRDVLLIKTDTSGTVVFSKTYGGASDDGGYGLQQNNNGGYMISGFTWSFGFAADDIYLINADNNGNLIWSKSFG